MWLLPNMVQFSTLYCIDGIRYLLMIQKILHTNKVCHLSHTVTVIVPIQSQTLTLNTNQDLEWMFTLPVPLLLSQTSLSLLPAAADGRCIAAPGFLSPFLTDLNGETKRVQYAQNNNYLIVFFFLHVRNIFSFFFKFIYWNTLLRPIWTPPSFLTFNLLLCLPVQSP